MLPSAADPLDVGVLLDSALRVFGTKALASFRPSLLLRRRETFGRPLLRSPAMESPQACRQVRLSRFLIALEQELTSSAFMFDF